jgi:hypothetical protein
MQVPLGILTIIFKPAARTQGVLRFTVAVRPVQFGRFKKLPPPVALAAVGSSKHRLARQSRVEVDM